MYANEQHQNKAMKKMDHKMTSMEITLGDRKSVVQGKSVDLGGRRIIKKKKRKKERKNSP